MGRHWHRSDAAGDMIIRRRWEATPRREIGRDRSGRSRRRRLVASWNFVFKSFPVFGDLPRWRHRFLTHPRVSRPFDRDIFVQIIRAYESHLVQVGNKKEREREKERDREREREREKDVTNWVWVSEVWIGPIRLDSASSAELRNSL